MTSESPKKRSTTVNQSFISKIVTKKVARNETPFIDWLHSTLRTPKVEVFFAQPLIRGPFFKFQRIVMGY